LIYTSPTDPKEAAIRNKGLVAGSVFFPSSLKSAEWYSGKVSPHLEEKLIKLNDLYKKFMCGEVGHEKEASDELGMLETETSYERFRRNRERWKETTK